MNAEGETCGPARASYLHPAAYVPHSFSVDSADAHVLNFYAPAGFELAVMASARLSDERRRATVDESALPNPREIDILSKIFGPQSVEAMPFCQPSVPALRSLAIFVRESGTLE